MREHQLAVLTRDVPVRNLRAGDVGAVVHVYDGARAFEVEFVTGSRQTLAVATLEPSDIRSVSAGEILHVRSVAAASKLALQRALGTAAGFTTSSTRS